MPCSLIFRADDLGTFFFYIERIKMDSKISNGNLDGKGHESPSTVEEDLSNTSPSITDHRQASPDSHRQVQKQHFEPIWRQAVLLHDDPRMEGQRRTVYWIKFLTTKHYLVILLLGQILAWCIVSTNTLTSMYLKYIFGTDIPSISCDWWSFNPGFSDIFQLCIAELGLFNVYDLPIRLQEIFQAALHRWMEIFPACFCRCRRGMM